MRGFTIVATLILLALIPNDSISCVVNSRNQDDNKDISNAQPEYETIKKCRIEADINTQGLQLESLASWDLYPLLNYVFFDPGSSQLAERYILFENSGQTEWFTDTTITGGTLDKYYHVLNIFAYRMKKYPASKIEIVGCNDGTTLGEKRKALSSERAQAIYDYFKNVWEIDKSRMKIVARGKPKHPSNINDSIAIRENRRAEIICKDWDIVKPVFDVKHTPKLHPETITFTAKTNINIADIHNQQIEIKQGEIIWEVIDIIGIDDTSKRWDWTNYKGRYPDNNLPFSARLIISTKSGAEYKSDPIIIPVSTVSHGNRRYVSANDSTYESYNLILFPVGISETGPLNDRIMREYICDRILPESYVKLFGHTSHEGIYKSSIKLANRRADVVEKFLSSCTDGKYAVMRKKAFSDEEPLFDNMLPEGRFYNRTVQVIIKTPVEDWEEIEKKQEAGVEVD